MAWGALLWSVIDEVQWACLKLLEYRKVLLSGKTLSKSRVKLTCFFTTPLYCSMAASCTPVTNLSEVSKEHQDEAFCRWFGCQMPRTLCAAEG